MPHHFLQLFVHMVWRVDARSPRIDGATQTWLWPALANKTRELGARYVVVGGVSDHVHVLTDLPPTMAVAELARRLKGASSRAIHLRSQPDFAWQEGYGAFSVSQSDVGAVASYVANQARHHHEESVECLWELNNSMDVQPRGHLEP